MNRVVLGLLLLIVVCFLIVAAVKLDCVVGLAGLLFLAVKGTMFEGITTRSNIISKINGLRLRFVFYCITHEFYL